MLPSSPVASCCTRRGQSSPSSGCRSVVAQSAGRRSSMILDRLQQGVLVQGASAYRRMARHRSAPRRPPASRARPDRDSGDQTDSAVRCSACLSNVDRGQTSTGNVIVDYRYRAVLKPCPGLRLVWGMPMRGFRARRIRELSATSVCPSTDGRGACGHC
jgi:hypothetical protein